MQWKITQNQRRKTIFNNKERVRVDYTIEVTGDYAIEEQGILYSNNGTRTSADFTIEDVDGTDVKKSTNLPPSNIADYGYGVLVRCYVKVNGVYIYSDDIGGKYADLKKPVLIEKTVSANGAYTAADDGADGYSKVTVSV